MNVTASAHRWWNQNVKPASDFGEEPTPPEPEDSTVLKSATIGGGVGALVGAGALYDNIRRDQPWYDSVTRSVPRAELGDTPELVFGGELGRFQQLVGQHSSNSGSAQSSLQYLAYLQEQAPKSNTVELSNVYQALENRFSDDTQVRTALNLITAHVTKHGSTPTQAYQHLSHQFELETDFERGTQTFLEAAKLSEDDLNETTFELVKRHTTTFGHLGMLKGVALGAGVGLVAGVAVGTLVGVVLKERGEG